MNRRREAGNSVLALLLLLVIAGGAGAWNYQKNVEAEDDVIVPAGRFRALRCVFRTRRMESVLWIAPGVGVVRETHGRLGRRPELERVLVAWSGGEERQNPSKP